MPDSVSILIIITLVLHLLFTYFMPPLVLAPAHPNRNDAAVIAVLVIVVVLVFWFLAPIHLPTLHMS